MNTLHDANGQAMTAEIEKFLMYLATERGLSTNYQLSVQRSLEGLRLDTKKHFGEGLAVCGTPTDH